MMLEEHRFRHDEEDGQTQYQVSVSDKIRLSKLIIKVVSDKFLLIQSVIFSVISDTKLSLNQL